MEDFAKLFVDEELGQILVLLDSNEDGNPSVQIRFIPKGLGVCGPQYNFNDTDDGWDQAEKLFREIKQEKAVDICSEISKKVCQALS